MLDNLYSYSMIVLMKPLIFILAIAVFFNRQINTMLTVDGAFTYYLPSMVKLALGLIALRFAYRAAKAIVRATTKTVVKISRKAISLSKRFRDEAPAPAASPADPDDAGDYDFLYGDDQTTEFAPVPTDEPTPVRAAPTYDDQTYWLDEPVPTS